MTPHILIVDDDPKLTEAVSWYLEAEGFRATRVANGEKALETFRADRPDVVIVDVMMPGMNGFELCRAIRKESKVPMLMLSARDAEVDKVRALDIGADDYVTKPFGAMELVARVKALLRRGGEAGGVSLLFPGIEILPEQRKVLVQGKEVLLSALEFDILVTLARRPEIVLSREQLADLVWGDDFSGDLRLVDSHVYRLRGKLTESGTDRVPLSRSEEWAMPSAPRFSVGARLTLTMVVVVVLTWLVGGAVIFQMMRLGVLRRGPPPGQPAEVIERGRGPGAEPTPPPQGRPGDRGPGGPPPGRGEQGAGHRPPPPPRSFLGGPSAVNLLVGILLSVAAGIWLSRRFTRPLAMLARGAGALGAGDLDHRVRVAGDDEFGQVAAGMNRMAERIGDQVRELQADARRRQQLLADVSHELRSPVATLKAMAEALRDGVAAGPERTERAIRAIVESAERMERLVNDLIELARLDLDEFPLHPAPIDLRMALADCLRRHSQAAESAGIRLHPPAEGVAVMVSGDPHRLAQVFDNLLDNSISHAGTGAEVRVTVEPGDPVTVIVSDTGRGIPAENLPYLFDAFYRGDASRTPGGRHSGLGLRIARGLAQAHGGDLQIESLDNRGTRAVLTLPALRESA